MMDREHLPNERPRIRYGPDDKIDSRAIEIVDKAFGVPPERLWMSHKTPVEAFLINKDPSIVRTFPGHTWVPFPDIPEDDKKFYEGRFPNMEKRNVLYPPVTPQEIRRREVRLRIKAIRKIEKAYGLKMKHFKKIDDYPKVTIADVADHIDRSLLNQFASGGEN